MALQTSGAISLADIAGEFGGAVPHSISEYYGVDSGIPGSGAISFADFYGASDVEPIPNWQANYRGGLDEEFTSAGISWRTEVAVKTTGNEPTYGGWVSLAGTGTFPCFYASSSSAADALIAEFESFYYFGLAGDYVTSNANANWDKIQMSADGGRTSYLVYASGVSLAAYPTQMQKFFDAINDTGTPAISDSQVDWYTV